jgi:glycosyltransferase involved in cell wall biosynthesis
MDIKKRQTGVSVIIPTFCRYEMLIETIQNVMNQSYKNVEIIIVDDCSNDQTPTIKERFPQIIYLRNDENRGPSYSRKRGLMNSNYSYIIFMDDDDYYCDFTFFEKAVEKLESNGNYNFIAGGAKKLYVDSSEIEERPLNVFGEMNAVEYLKGFALEYKTPFTFAIVYSYRALIDNDVLNMYMLNHVPLLLRCLREGKVFFFCEAVGVYRIHGNNISSKIPPNFLIDNLKEKYDVYCIIKEKELFDTYEFWWKKQVEMTVSYFVYESTPSFREYYKVKKWCFNHIDDKNTFKDIFMKFDELMFSRTKCAIKRAVKKILRMK